MLKNAKGEMLKKKTQKEVIDEFKKIHGDKYDYSLVEYKNNFTKVCVICKRHGKFMITPSHHKKGVKCWRCSYEERALNKIQKEKNEFESKARKIHGDKYDYSLVEYKNNKSPVKIKCKTCGNIFEQTPNVHKNGSGCPICGKESIKRKIIPLDLETEFEGKNYREEYIKLINNARNNIPNNYEIHHILPKSIFPLWKSKKSNLIKLSLEDHYKAHYLLYKIYDSIQMTYSLKQFLNMTNKQYNPSLYKETKEKIIDKLGKKVYCFEENKIYNSCEEAGLLNGLKSGSSIVQVCKHKLFDKTRGNNKYHFCYLEDKEKALEFWSSKA